MKKGMALPIEVVIILVIAIVVLIAIILFFTTTMKKSEGSMKEQQDWQKACGALRMMKCDVSKIGEIYGNRMVGDEGDTSSLCYMIAGTNDHETCCKVCCGDDPGCGGGPTET